METIRGNTVSNFPWRYSLKIILAFLKESGQFWFINTVQSGQVDWAAIEEINFFLKDHSK